MARNKTNTVRQLQRTLYHKAKQDIRFRRYLTFRSKGRGFGWKKYPNKRLYAMGHYLHRQRPYQVSEGSCACLVTKAVGPPYSGKLNVRWDGKGMGTRS
jgi:hypothetical protein